ncbi:unnamed protein product [Moneuplotes crassus]|uniref:Poly [ADP-ribose] polymerase n=2 Tax=Euplotes crassus TaxID=5936 RepID=A0AAD1U893_EUPCR|nr:unnamed protein product [Moneuplotes crassus]
MAGKRKTRAKVAPTACTNKASDATPKATQGKPKKRDTKAEDKNNEESKDQIKEISAAMSNGVMVDHKVPDPGSFEVVSVGGKVLNTHLMLADCIRNNNKFYIIQGLKKGSSFMLWTRWGRVGVDGQTGKTMVSNENALLAQFNKKMKAKTNKGYNEIEISYEEVEETTKKIEALEEKKKGEDTEPQKKKESVLPSSVQDLLRFIFDMKMIEKSVVKVGFNVKKLPLGKLSKATITKGYEVLRKIDQEMKNLGSQATLGTLSSEFYSIIPHDFGFAKLSQFVINTKEKLKDKLELVEALGDIQIAAEIMNDANKDNSDKNELDAKYDMMKCKIVPLDKDHQDYDNLVKTITSTHGSTHYFNVKPLEIFKIEREGEEERFNQALSNKKLLWHGSRFSNWGGILSQGLRIAPPEAPATGYMFGKGVYFADIVTKSAGYCCSHISNSEGLLALCEVALGDTRDLKNADYNANRLPAGKGSTKGVGRWVPENEVDIDGVPAYVGPIKDLGSNYYLRYNEFITYDVSNVKIKYLFRCKIG